MFEFMASFAFARVLMRGSISRRRREGRGNVSPYFHLCRRILRTLATLRDFIMNALVMAGIPHARPMSERRRVCLYLPSSAIGGLCLNTVLRRGMTVFPGVDRLPRPAVAVAVAICLPLHYSTSGFREGLPKSAGTSPDGLFPLAGFVLI